MSTSQRSRVEPNGGGTMPPRTAAGASRAAQSERLVVADGMLSPARPLHPELRARFEPRFGHDFSRVRIYSGPQAASAAERLHARAYTLDEAIVWGARDAVPDRQNSHHLLAHELAHVVQQRRSHGQLRASSPSGEVEADANRAAQQATEGRRACPQLAAAPDSPLKQDIDDPALRGRSVLTLGNRHGAGRRLSSTEWILQGFATDSDELTEAHERILASIAQELNENGLGYQGFVTIWGRADSRATEEHNRALGQRRADRVRARLAALVTSPETAAQIRAYSLGESFNERQGDVSEYRQVSVTISRGSYVMSQSPASPSVRTPASPRIDVPGLFRPNLVLPPQLPLLPTRPTLPPDFWVLNSPHPVPRDLLNELSRAITGPLGREQIAGLAAHIASGLGFDETQTRHKLDDALINGGEAALREALRALIQAIVGPPVSPSSNQYGPALQEMPTPPIIQTPPIPLPF